MSIPRLPWRRSAQPQRGVGVGRALAQGQDGRRSPGSGRVHPAQQDTGGAGGLRSLPAVPGGCQQELPGLAEPEADRGPGRIPGAGGAVPAGPPGHLRRHPGPALPEAPQAGRSPPGPGNRSLLLPRRGSPVGTVGEVGGRHRGRGKAPARGGAPLPGRAAPSARPGRRADPAQAATGGTQVARAAHQGGATGPAGPAPSTWPAATTAPTPSTKP